MQSFPPTRRAEHRPLYWRSLQAQTPHGIFNTDHQLRVRILSRRSYSAGAAWHSWLAVECYWLTTTSSSLERYRGGSPGPRLSTQKPGARTALRLELWAQQSVSNG